MLNLNKNAGQYLLDAVGKETDQFIFDDKLRGSSNCFWFVVALCFPEKFNHLIHHVSSCASYASFRCKMHDWFASQGNSAGGQSPLRTRLIGTSKPGL